MVVSALGEQLGSYLTDMPVSEFLMPIVKKCCKEVCELLALSSVFSVLHLLINACKAGPIALEIYHNIEC